MNGAAFNHVNLVMAWAWILGGFVSGMVLGLGFHRDGWLGGYGSFRRRLYRLGHISFFGLGTVNLLFYLSFRDASVSTPLSIASRCLILGALTMPLCCVLLAHAPRCHLVFSIPVVSLLLGGGLVLRDCLKSTMEKPSLRKVVAAPAAEPAVVSSQQLQHP